MRRLDWADYRTTEYASIDPMRTIAILPTAAVEQHGPHLPVGVDTMIAEGLLARLRQHCPEDLDIRILPVQSVGKSNEHLHAPGTLSLSAENALRVQARMLAVKCQWGSFGQPEGMYPARELAYGIHGGDVETSLMLAFRPETVDMRAAQDFRSSAETATIPPTGPISYGWISSDLNMAGTVGNAANATAEKGDATASHYVAEFVRLLHQVAAHPLPD